MSSILIVHIYSRCEHDLQHIDCMNISIHSSLHRVEAIRSVAEVDEDIGSMLL